MGQLIVLATVHVALIGFFGAHVVARLAGGWNRRPRGLVALWNLGAFSFLTHVLCAFHVHHDWSHASAVADTARSTQEILGRAYGGGVFFSYAFTLLWPVDALWILRFPRSHSGRPQAVKFIVHGYLLFIVFNGTIVFEAGVVRLVSALAFLLLASLTFFSRTFRTTAT